jgi:predicted transcriptional regulator
MATVTIRMSDDLKEFYTDMAEFEGTNVSDLIKKKSLEQLEDEYDARVGELAYLEYLQEGKEATPMDDLYKEFGIK